MQHQRHVSSLVWADAQKLWPAMTQERGNVGGAALRPAALRPHLVVKEVVAVHIISIACTAQHSTAGGVRGGEGRASSRRRLVRQGPHMPALLGCAACCQPTSHAAPVALHASMRAPCSLPTPPSLPLPAARIAPPPTTNARRGEARPPFPSLSSPSMVSSGLVQMLAARSGWVYWMPAAVGWYWYHSG